MVDSRGNTVSALPTSSNQSVVVVGRVFRGVGDGLHFVIEEIIETVGCIELMSGAGKEVMVVHETVTRREETA